MSASIMGAINAAIDSSTVRTASANSSYAGFAPDAPEADIRAAAVALVEDVRAGRQHLIALEADGALAGTVFLRRGDRPVIRHRADVLKLMVHPDLQGRGWGKALLDAAVAECVAYVHELKEKPLGARRTPVPPERST
jgi:GNAT superfamily N-acetyltransferase